MLIPDEIRKCVAFLMYRDATRFKFAGTCFFVATPLSEDPKKPNFMYIVTAAHVIRVMKEKSVDGKAYVCLNFPDSTVKVSPTPLEAWLSHPTDPTVDIAVLPRKPPPGADYLVYPMDRFATEDVISKEGIGLGEEVFVVGLFHEHVGKKRNIPIIRVGNIAAMPEEPVGGSQRLPCIRQSGICKERIGRGEIRLGGKRHLLPARANARSLGQVGSRYPGERRNTGGECEHGNYDCCPREENLGGHKSTRYDQQRSVRPEWCKRITRTLKTELSYS